MIEKGRMVSVGWGGWIGLLLFEKDPNAIEESSHLCPLVDEHLHPASAAITKTEVELNAPRTLDFYRALDLDNNGATGPQNAPDGNQGSVFLLKREFLAGPLVFDTKRTTSQGRSDRLFRRTANGHRKHANDDEQEMLHLRRSIVIRHDGAQPRRCL